MMIDFYIKKRMIDFDLRVIPKVVAVNVIVTSHA